MRWAERRDTDRRAALVATGTPAPDAGVATDADTASETAPGTQSGSTAEALA